MHEWISWTTPSVLSIKLFWNPVLFWFDSIVLFDNVSISSLIFILVKCRPAVLSYGYLHLLCNNCTLLHSQIEPNQSHLIKQMPEARINTGFRHSNPLFKLANKISSLYFSVLVLWFYLVLYVFNCPKSIDCTERCYQFVILILLSITFS